MTTGAVFLVRNLDVLWRCRDSCVAQYTSGNYCAGRVWFNVAEPSPPRVLPLALCRQPARYVSENTPGLRWTCGTERSGVVRIHARDDSLTSDLPCAIGLGLLGQGVIARTRRGQKGVCSSMVEMTDAFDGPSRFCAPFLSL